MSGRTLIFNYGSNLLSQRLSARVGAFRTLAVATLDDHRLTFNKKGGDVSGKCNVEFSSGDRVLGTVVELDDAQLAILDEVEGEGERHGYTRHPQRVRAGNEDVAVWLYQANALGEALPFRWYRDFVYIGALQHGLPTSYLADIARQAVTEDPDEQRAAQNADVIRKALRTPDQH